MLNEIKRLVIFTAHYPYTSGESFLEDEMKYAANLFDEILIVTAEKSPTSDRYYIPDHAKVIESRKGLKRYIGLAVACMHLLLPTTMREIKYGIREQKGIRRAHEILKKIIITEGNIATTKMSFSKWYSKEPTLYYAYWLDAEATYLSRIRAKLNGPCIARAHGYDCFFNRDYHPYRRLQLSNMDAIYPISKAGSIDITTYYSNLVHGLKEKIHTVYLGVAIPDRQSAWKKQRVITIVSCAEIKELKRVDLLIDALALVDFSVRWIHFGDGETGCAIRNYAKEKLGAKQNIVYEFTGRILKADILEFYEKNSVDIFVNSSDYEGIPVSVMEAMAYGIPAIVRDVGGNAELVNNKCGFLLQSSADAKEIADTIRIIAEMEEAKMLTLRKAARSQIASVFTDVENMRYLYGQYVSER